MLLIKLYIITSVYLQTNNRYFMQPGYVWCHSVLDFCCLIQPIVMYVTNIYIYIYVYGSQIVHHSPCFNLFILHNNLFDNQGSEISKNDIFFTIRHTVFYKTLYR